MSKMGRKKKQDDRKRIQKYIPIRPAPKVETTIGTHKFTNIPPWETESDLFSASPPTAENELAFPKLQKKKSAPYMKSAGKCV